MKKTILTTLTAAMALFSGTAMAGSKVSTMTCDLNSNHSTIVDKLILQYTEPDSGKTSREYIIHYTNGEVEVGEIAPGVLKDQFGNSLRSELNRPYVAMYGTGAGDIFVSSQCALAKGIPSIRCVSQGSGQYAAYSSAILHLDGKKLDFRGYGQLPTCTNTVQRTK